MAEVNRVDFKYDCVGGDLYTDSFRTMFYTERWDGVRDALQALSFDADLTRIVRGEMEGTITFYADDERTPVIDIVGGPTVKLP